MEFRASSIVLTSVGQVDSPTRVARDAHIGAFIATRNSKLSPFASFALFYARRWHESITTSARSAAKDSLRTETGRPIGHAVASAASKSSGGIVSLGRSLTHCLNRVRCSTTNVATAIRFSWLRPSRSFSAVRNVASCTRCGITVRAIKRTGSYFLNEHARGARRTSTPTRQSDRFCSQQCGRHAAKFRAQVRRHNRLITAGDVDRVALWMDTNKTCHICGLRCQGGLPPLHNLAATIDHVIPVERWRPEDGDPNQRSNVRLAHRICNGIKSNFDLNDSLRAEASNRVVMELVAIAERSFSQSNLFHS